MGVVLAESEFSMTYGVGPRATRVQGILQKKLS